MWLGHREQNLRLMWAPKAPNLDGSSRRYCPTCWTSKLGRFADRRLILDSAQRLLGRLRTGGFGPTLPCKLAPLGSSLKQKGTVKELLSAPFQLSPIRLGRPGSRLDLADEFLRAGEEAVLDQYAPNDHHGIRAENIDGVWHRQ